MKYLLTFLLLIPAFAYSSSYISGEVTSITSYSGGLLIRVNGNQKPSACTQSTSWMIIPEENQTMITVALAMYMSGNRNAVVYVAPFDLSYGYCKITQFDPQH